MKEMVLSFIHSKFLVIVRTDSEVKEHSLDLPEKEQNARKN